MIRQKELAAIKMALSGYPDELATILSSLAAELACIQAYTACEPCPVHDALGTEPLPWPL